MTYEEAFAAALEVNEASGRRYFIFKDVVRGTYHVTRAPICSHQVIRIGEVRRFCK